VQYIEIESPPDFTLRAVIDSHGWSALEPFDADDSRERLGYAFLDSRGQPVSVDVDQGTPLGVRVVVMSGSRLSESNRSFITRTMRRVLAMDVDLSGFYRLARKEPKLRGSVRTGAGRFLRSATLFEDIVKTILTTNVTWAGTKAMVSKLVKTFGRPAPGGRMTFPSPADLAREGPEVLQSEARLGYRAGAVHHLAAAYHEGRLTDSQFDADDIPTEDLRKRLLELKGVGPYAAATLLILLGRFEHLPIDSWAHTLVSHEWHGGSPVLPADIEGRFESWGKWKALAYWLWDWSYPNSGDN